MRSSISTEGIVLSSRAYSEADKIITIYTAKHGKLSFIAKGVKRPKSRKRGSLEVFSHVKLQAQRGKGMPLLTEVEILDSFNPIRKDLKKVAVAYFIAETILRTTRDEEPHAEIYWLLVHYLTKLKKEVLLKKLRNEFSLELAETLGFIPKGQFVPDTDELLESIIERKLGSVRVGKKLQS